MAELVVASDSQLDSDTKCFDRHDGDGADGRADGDVNERVSTAIPRGDFVYHGNGKDGDKETVEEEHYADSVSANHSLSKRVRETYAGELTWLYSKVQNLIDGPDVSIPRRMHHQHNRTK